MTETPTPEDDDVTSMSGEVTAPSEGDKAVQEIARSHPSAGSDSDPQGAEQEQNTEGSERAGQDEAGAGADYAGSGF